MVSSTERPWYRLHLVTAIALAFVGGCLGWCDLVGSRQSLKYLWSGTRSFGWPWEHFDGLREFSPGRAAADALVAGLILAAVAAVVETRCRSPARRPQLRIGDLLLIVAVVAPLIALVRVEADWLNWEWTPGRYVPLSWYPPPVLYGVLAGLGCALFAT